MSDFHSHSLSFIQMYDFCMISLAIFVFLDRFCCKKLCVLWSKFFAPNVKVKSLQHKHHVIMAFHTSRFKHGKHIQQFLNICTQTKANHLKQVKSLIISSYSSNKPFIELAINQILGLIGRRFGWEVNNYRQVFIAQTPH